MAYPKGKFRVASNEEVFNKLFDIIDKNKGIKFWDIVKLSGWCEHTIRRALKVLIKRHLVMLYPLGKSKRFYTLNRIIRYYPIYERDRIYLNYLTQFPLGVSQSKMAEDLDIGINTLKKELIRLLKADKITRINEHRTLIIYKLKEAKDGVDTTRTDTNGTESNTESNSS